MYNLSDLGKQLLQKMQGDVVVQKSDLPGKTGEDLPPKDGDNAPDLEALKTEILSALENGDIEPNSNAVIAWAKEKGLPDEQTDDFATDVLTKFFKTDDTGDGDGDEPGAVEKSALREFLEQGKRINAQSGDIIEIKKSMGIMMKAMERVLDNQKRDSDEFQVLKSQLGTIPAVNRQPVLNANPAGGIPGYKETSELVLKAALAGKIMPTDAATWEQKGVLTASAERVITEMRKNG
jgi:hypothetical protein